MIAPRPSRSERRRIVARALMWISVEPLSDGEWCAVLMDDGKEVYRSASRLSPEEALPLATFELEALVERRLEAEDQTMEEA